MFNTLLTVNCRPAVQIHQTKIDGMFVRNFEGQYTVLQQVTKSFSGDGGHCLGLSTDLGLDLR